jgi:hypothetical protein
VTRRTSTTVALIIAVAIALLVSITMAAASGERQLTGSAVAGCGFDRVPLVQHHYRLDARVRVLLFWVGRSNVGGARLAWSPEAAGARRFELLIGSDPQRAPMRINRWGYLAETVCGATAHLVGVMTETKEQSLDQARVVDETGGRHAFNAIHASVAAGVASGTVARFVLIENPTYRDVEMLLRRQVPEDAAVRRLRLPEGTEPGFMVTMRGLIRDSVDRFHASGRVAARPDLRRAYTYNAQLYDAAVRSSKLIAQATVNGRTHRSVIESEFEVRNRSTRETTTFRVTYGTDEALAGVPVRIVFRPKWWFEAELLLDERSVL